MALWSLAGLSTWLAVLAVGVSAVGDCKTADVHNTGGSKGCRPESTPPAVSGVSFYQRRSIINKTDVSEDDEDFAQIGVGDGSKVAHDMASFSSSENQGESNIDMFANGTDEQLRTHLGTCRTVNPATQSDAMRGRCGPKHGHFRCNKIMDSWAVYCNEANGWCGSSSAHRHAQSSDEYDWEPAACTARCAAECKSQGFCCNNYKIGSNQMISCAQACMIRTRGLSQAMCTSHCSRHGGSGCRKKINRDTYRFCSRCTDLTNSPKCAHGVASPDACQTGCLMTNGQLPVSTTQAPASAPVAPAGPPGFPGPPGPPGLAVQAPPGPPGPPR